MADYSQDRRRLMTKISLLYYNENLSQQEISDKINISRPQVSRLLSLARSEGIVDITVKDAYADERKYETWLCETFSLKNAIVVDTSNADFQTTIKMLASGMSEMLDTILSEGDVIGVSAGASISDICAEIRTWPCRRLSFVPLVGGIGVGGTRWQANSNARRFAEKCKCPCWQLSAPMVVTNDEAYTLLTREPEIRKVLDIAKNCSVVLTGIGQFSADATFIKTGFLEKDELQKLKDAGAIGSVCCSCIDSNGNPLEMPFEKRMVGLGIADLERIPNVVALSYGLNKVPAIAAALKGKWMNELVTDLTTAKALMARYFKKGNSE